MKKNIFFILLISLLFSCSSSQSRIDQCVKEGVSRDTCYIAEQNRKNIYLENNLKTEYKYNKEAKKLEVIKH